MKCPYCSFEFPLTWERYLKEPFKHTCPSCKKKAKLLLTRKYILCSLLPVCVLAGGLTFLSIYLSGGHVYLGLLLVMNLALITAWLPVDRYCDENMRSFKADR